MRRYVQRAKATALPKDTWRGRTFVEATGEQLEVVWDGKRESASLCGEDWPSAHSSLNAMDTTLRLRTGKGKTGLGR